VSTTDFHQVSEGEKSTDPLLLIVQVATCWQQHRIEEGQGHLVQAQQQEKLSERIGEISPPPLLKRVPPSLPVHSAQVSVASENRAFLLSSYDPKPGSVVVTHEEGSSIQNMESFLENIGRFDIKNVDASVLECNTTEQWMKVHLDTRQVSPGDDYLELQDEGCAMNHVNTN
jgi:hypothetical protein